MWSTSIGHHKDSHRNWRSDWLVVEWRDCHYQMILENRDPKGRSHLQKKSQRVWSTKVVRFDTAVYIIHGKTSIHLTQLCLPDGKGPCQSLPQLARNYHLQTEHIMFSIYSTIWQKCTCRNQTITVWYNTDDTKMVTAPAMFSWKITLVPLRKFFPMIKTSSPPLTEQLWRLFFRISGTPAGWAGNWQKSQWIKTHMITGSVFTRDCYETDILIILRDPYIYDYHPKYYVGSWPNAWNQKKHMVPNI